MNPAAIREEPFALGPPGAVLRGLLALPPEPALLVTINGATGVPARFYQPFARWLAAERNAAVLTWDYRDFGASGAPYRSSACMTDWVLHDPVTVRQALRARFPGLPLWLIGHSLGGIAAGFQADIGDLDRVITVAAGHGHISDHPPGMRIRASLLWYLLGPVSTAALGYLPARWLGLGLDLPKGVFWQWRRWLLDRGGPPADPALGGLRRPGITGPLTLIALSDDTMLPPASVERMRAWHPGAEIDYRLIRPGDAGLAAIGHIQAFHSRNAVLWPRLIA